jgi:hypothetical protein
MKSKDIEKWIWPVVVLIIGFLLVFTLREYLADKNEIEAERSRASCLIEAEKAGMADFENCNNIATYKVGEQGKY